VRWACVDATDEVQVAYEELWKKEVCIEKARESYRTAIEIFFRHCGTDGWVKKYKEGLVGLISALPP
jgi:hypothetical protein